MNNRDSSSETPDTRSKNKIIQDLIKETCKKLNMQRRQRTRDRSHKKDTKLERAIAQQSPKVEEPPSESPTVLLPSITETNWKNFEERLNNDTMDEVTKKLNACLIRMHGWDVVETHFTSLHFVRKALIEALMSRNWDNLLILVVMFAKNYSSPVFTPFIRLMCQILKYYHPGIRGTELEDQIDLIIEKHSRRHDARINHKTYLFEKNNHN
ncbi:uncharacterized protein LOC126743068 [Anthonomus grandis grandis]|uniref:uncharacterized protein LOC126743068 n=1 Tax=Anthonomus grandis grandis TaxID=2921223 RepID=UPI00216674F7|nr:uncharacterized protein LOC126743068 [Anthonomus grandis grandis]